jgi:hypothetical protein
MDGLTRTRSAAVVCFFFTATRAVEKIAFRVYIEGMRRDEVIARLKQTEPALKAFGVAALYLFRGSPKTPITSG